MRLLQGDYDRATVYSEDPLEMVRRFAHVGARRVHVVDLDAARGSGENRGLIEAMVRGSEVELQVAGGVRSADDVTALVAAGSDRVVMGTTAVEDPALLENVAAQYPGRVVTALDLREGRPAVKGWTETSAAGADELLRRWNSLPLGGVVLTCIDRDGTLAGPDLATLRHVRAMTKLELQYSGGVSSLEDVDRVAAAYADAVVIGTAIYEGRIELGEAFAR